MTIRGKKIIMLLGPRYQDAEAKEPLEFFREKGVQVDVVGLRREKLTGLKGQAEIEVDFALNEIGELGEYDAMLIPGGRSPAALRKNPDALRLVKEFYGTGKPVAAICHGPQLLAAAGLLDGKTITGYGKIRNEMLDAGATFVDEPVVMDGNLITSRVPADIPLFNAALEESLAVPGQGE